MHATLHNTPPMAAQAAQRGWPQRLAAVCRALALVPPASMLLASGALAQSSGCEQFRDKLATRVDPSIRGFTLDIVASSAPLPPGAKVFGTCDGGAYKILFRRGGNTRPVPSGEAAVAAASAVQAKPAAPEPATKPPAVQTERTPRPAATASVPGPVAPPPPLPAPVAATPVAPPALEPDKPVVTPAREVDPAPDRTPPPAPPTEPPAQAASQSTPMTSGDFGFIAGAWHWLGLLLLLPVAGGLWAWYAHRSAYDEAGLPRGPRL